MIPNTPNGYKPIDKEPVEKELFESLGSINLLTILEAVSASTLQSVPFAAEFAKFSRCEEALRALAGEDAQAFVDMCKAHALLLEMRIQALYRAVLSTKPQCVVHIGGGLMPLCVNLAATAGIPALLLDLKAAALHLGIVNGVNANPTDPIHMAKAFECCPHWHTFGHHEETAVHNFLFLRGAGSVCVVIGGMPFLSAGERDTLAANVKRILRDRKGSVVMDVMLQERLRLGLQQDPVLARAVRMIARIAGKKDIILDCPKDRQTVTKFMCACGANHVFFRSEQELAGSAITAAGSADTRMYGRSSTDSICIATNTTN